MAPRSRSNGLTYAIGTKLGQLEEAHKTATARLTSVEAAVGNLANEIHSYKDDCGKKFDSIQSSLDDIRNPKFSRNDVLHALKSSITYAGGAATSIGAVYLFIQAIFKWLFH